MKPGIAPWRAIVLAGLVSLNIGLAAIAGSAVLPDDARAPARVDWKPPIASAGTALPDPKPIAAYLQTLAHPIFFKNRAPFVPPPPTPPPAPMMRPSQSQAVADPGIALGGIMVMQGAHKAYLFRKTDPSGTWVADGEDFMGWRIQTIDAAGIVLTNGERKIDLKLYPER
jgi:hypothetical protein